MSVAWLSPAAWWGLAALVVPIAVHLLFRPRSRRLPFPSLRFLRGSRLAALRRRHVSDWPLLLVRVLMLAVAVAATASPVFVTPSRREAWSTRVARAIIVAPDSAPESAAAGSPLTGMLGEERRTAFRSAVFAAAIPADGLRDAVEWLRHQPPAAREVVLAGDLRDGSLIGADVNAVPPAFGVRFLPPAGPRAAGREALVRTVTLSAAAPALSELRLGLDDLQTIVEYRPVATGPELAPVEVRARSGDQARAQAALHAVLAEGVLLPREGGPRLLIEFGVAPARSPAGVPPSEPWMRRVLAHSPDASGREENGRFIVGTPLDPGDATAPHFVARVLSEAWAMDWRGLEPRPIPAPTLAAWSRPPGPVAPDAAPADEGDRRSLWLAVLGLLALEHWMRRPRRSSPPRVAEAPNEVQVA